MIFLGKKWPTFTPAKAQRGETAWGDRDPTFFKLQELLNPFTT